MHVLIQLKCFRWCCTCSNLLVIKYGNPLHTNPDYDLRLLFGWVLIVDTQIWIKWQLLIEKQFFFFFGFFAFNFIINLYWIFNLVFNLASLHGKYVARLILLWIFPMDSYNTMIKLPSFYLQMKLPFLCIFFAFFPQ